MIEYIFDLIISLFMIFRRYSREVTLSRFEQHESMHTEPIIESTDFVPVSIVQHEDPDFAY